MKQVGVGLVGAGQIGQYHLNAVARLPHTRLAAICDTNRDSARAAATKTDVPVFENLDTMLALPQVDAVVLATPTLLHYSQTLSALRAGKHVLVEKPMAGSLVEAQEMVFEAQQKRKILMVGQVMRFMPNFNVVHNRVEQGAIGQLIHFIERRLEWRPDLIEWWRAQDNILIAHRCSHTLDLIQWLFNLQVRQVSCISSANHPGFPGEDDFGALFSLEGGSYADLQHSLICRERIHDIVIIGEHGTIRFEGFGRVFLNSRLVWEGNPVDALQSGILAQMEEFATAILDDREPIASGQQVLPTMAALEATLTSSREQRVVSILKLK
jgi:2-hydroxy-4-carboxymuconate semialdehyde hemiacetal dehydrogenase